MLDKILPSLEEIIDLDQTSRWRSEKAEQYPDDDRNEIAAQHLSKLYAELEALEGSPLHRRLVQLMGEGEGERCFDIISENLRGVGFTWMPDSAAELLSSICDDLASAVRASQGAD